MKTFSSSEQEFSTDLSSFGTHACRARLDQLRIEFHAAFYSVEQEVDMLQIMLQIGSGNDWQNFNQNADELDLSRRFSRSTN